MFIRLEHLIKSLSNNKVLIIHIDGTFIYSYISFGLVTCITSMLLPSQNWQAASDHTYWSPVPSLIRWNWNYVYIHIYIIKFLPKIRRINGKKNACQLILIFQCKVLVFDKIRKEKLEWWIQTWYVHIYAWCWWLLSNFCPILSVVSPLN